MSSINVQYKNVLILYDTIFVNSKNSKIYDPNRLLLNITDKINVKNDKYVALSNFSKYYI